MRWAPLARASEKPETVFDTARQAAGSFVLQEKKRPWQGPVWAGLGALVTGLVWVLTVVLWVLFTQLLKCVLP